LLTTTGQFGTDKFTPVGLNPNATGADYLKQVADTIAQTIMQSGMMAGGTTGVSKAVRFMNEDGKLTTDNDAEFAKQQALNKWNTNGLNSRIEPTLTGTPAATSVTPDGRIEPTLNPTAEQSSSVQPAEPAGAPAINPMVETADSIVRELAQEAGIPEATVLPTPAPPQQTDAPESVSDQDVQDFAASRYQQLREKRDGSIQSVVGESGMVDQDMPGAGLSPAEQTELDTLQRAGNDPTALRQLYGFDTGPVEQPVAGDVFQATTEPGLVAAQQQENPSDETQEQTQGTGPALESGARCDEAHGWRPGSGLRGGEGHFRGTEDALAEAGGA
jgi:hypothetical protein